MYSGRPTETYDVTAVSFAAYPSLRDKYILLDCGASFGEGYGPIVVSTKSFRPQDLKGKRVIVLTNAEEDFAFESILYHILDGYLGGPTEDYTVAFKSVVDKERKKADETMAKAAASRAADSKPSLPLEKYAGDYSDAWYGTVTIRPENGGLVLNFLRTNKGLADLQHWQYDTFKAHWRDRTVEDAFVTFALNPDGSIDHFTMLAVSPLADFSFDYQDLYFTPVKTPSRP